MKYYLVTLLINDGGAEYFSKSAYKCIDKADINLLAGRAARTWYDTDDYTTIEKNKSYSFTKDGGDEVICTVQNCEEISATDYEVLNRYLN